MTDEVVTEKVGAVIVATGIDLFDHKKCGEYGAGRYPDVVTSIAYERMSALYTLEGSGHNPRAARAQRLRNRVGHKFCYHPREFPGGAGGQPEVSCTGCGRCIKSCPVSVDIRHIVRDILEKGEGK